jgi:hypothetical protein
MYRNIERQIFLLAAVLYISPVVVGLLQSHDFVINSRCCTGNRHFAQQHQRQVFNPLPMKRSGRILVPVLQHRQDSAHHDEVPIAVVQENNNKLQKERALLKTPTPKAIISRRTALRNHARIAMSLGAITSSTMSTTVPSLAAPDATQSATNDVINQLFDQLHTIPTFCIVSSKTGAAYMIYKQDLNMGIGYAFMTYTGALAVLKDAQQNAIQKGYGDIWTNATITTIPLDVAVRLTLKKRSRMSTKEQSLDTLLMLIPGADDRLDGIAIDKSRFQDQGRVPLFYVANDDSSKDNNIDAKVFYFNRQDLVAEWIENERQQERSTGKNDKQSQLPAIKAIDLVGIFESLLLGRNVKGKVSNLLLSSSKFRFVPNLENVAIAQEMKARGLSPYNPNKMIL